MRKDLLITIDGPSGAGKSTVAKKLAQRIDYSFLDTGAMYRALAYASMKYGKEPEELIGKIKLHFDFQRETRVFLDGEDISEVIREPSVSVFASRISKKRKVREFLTNLQREIGRKGGIVAEGRDTGTVVFPEAQIKFYIDAQPEERIKRRYKELLEKGKDVDYEKLKEETLERDREDSTRDIAPLSIPKDAIYIDTTFLSIEEVIEIMLSHIKDHDRGF